MAQNPEVSPISIDSLRANDEKDTQNEISPEKQTLNSSRVLSFLHRNGVTVDNWESTFSLNLALNLTGEGKTSTEKMLNSQFKDAEQILKKYDRLDVMTEKSEAVVSGKLENLKTAPANMLPAEAAKVMQAWSYFNLIREHSWRLLQMEATMKDTRKRQFEGDKSTSETIMGGVKEKLGDARENWDKLSSGQKMAMAGMALLAGIWLFKSQNETIKGIKDTLVTGVKVAGAAWLFNKVWYLFTGEGVLDTVTGTAKSSNRHSKFLMDTFKTDEKGAEALSKAFVQMGDVSFIDLANRYDQAAKSGKRTIEGTRMPPEEAFKAMELFFSKYGNIDKLKQEYGKYNPPIAFNQVVTIEMSKDPSVKMQEALTTRVYDGVGDYLKRGYNYLGSTAPAVWMASKYESWFGKKPTPQELQDFTKKFGEVVKTENEVNGVIESKVVTDKKIAKQFIDTNLAGVTAPKFNLKYRVADDGYVYMIVEKPINNVQGDEKALSDTIQSCVDTAENFLVDKYKVPKDAATKKCTPHGSVFVTATGTLKYLVRYKI